MTDEVLFMQEGSLGVITLNRPKALNSLTLTMILAVQKQLSLWKKDNTIHAVVVRALPGNAFCAGGDIRSLYDARQAGDAEQMRFFWHEYQLNHFIHHFGKPYISLIDGIVMGGGVGISMHGSHPVAGEHFLFAMPETGIGFFPDIGASYLLTRCPGNLGLYLGLTGTRLDAQNAMKAGLVKKIVPSELMPALYDRLKNEDLSQNSFARVDQCLQEFSQVPSETKNEISSLIDSCFVHSSVEMIRESLCNNADTWAIEVNNTLAQKSPLSLKVTLAQLQKAKGLSLAACLKMDFTLAKHFMHGNDFYEGVRALIIDKDKNPQWNPSSLDLISEKTVENYFLPFHPELKFIE